MNVRWTAVITGFVADLLISIICVLALGTPDFALEPNLARTSDVILIVLLTLSTGVGGYIAGRMAKTDRVINGLLVGAVGVLYGQIGGGDLPRVMVVASAIGCLLAALGGYLSRFPAQAELTD